MNIPDKPTLQGEKVVLRPVNASDAEAAFEMVNNPESRRLTGTQETFTLEQLRAWYGSVGSREGRIDLAITESGTGVFVGEVVLNDIDEDNCSASFRIVLRGQVYFGKGYGSEATKLVLAYGFDVLELNRIDLEVFAFNPRAVHVYEKAGFRREGVLREVLWADETFHDAIVMSVLRKEYEAF